MERKPPVPVFPQLGMENDNLYWRMVPHAGHWTALDSPVREQQTTPSGPDLSMNDKTDCTQRAGFRANPLVLELTLHGFSFPDYIPHPKR